MEDILQDELVEDPMENLDEAFKYNGKPKIREEKVELGGRTVYPCDPVIPKNALTHAHLNAKLIPII